MQALLHLRIGYGPAAYANPSLEALRTQWPQLQTFDIDQDSDELSLHYAKALHQQCTHMVVLAEVAPAPPETNTEEHTQPKAMAGAETRASPQPPGLGKLSGLLNTLVMNREQKVKGMVLLGRHPMVEKLGKGLRQAFTQASSPQEAQAALGQWLAEK